MLYPVQVLNRHTPRPEFLQESLMDALIEHQARAYLEQLDAVEYVKRRAPYYDNVRHELLTFEDFLRWNRESFECRTHDPKIRTKRRP